MTTNRRLTTTTLVAVLTTATAVVSCRAPATEPPSSPSPLPAQSTFANWPPTLDNFRFHWAATPGIDLTTGPAVLVRAYVESMDVARLTRGDPSTVYPGFDRATPENVGDHLSPDPFELKNIRPIPGAGVDPSTRADIFGYQPNVLLSVEPVGNGYRATVCSGTYATFRADDTDPTKFRSVGSSDRPDNPSKGIFAYRVDFTDQDPRTLSAPPSSTPPQSGPSPAPIGDVFGRWFVTAASYTLWGVPGKAVPVATPEQMQQCEALMPDDAAARQAMYTGLHDEPPPHGDPIPGWPAESR